MSQTQSASNDGDEDAILRVSAYERHDLASEIINFADPDMALSAVMLSSHAEEPSATLGVLDQFPAEIQEQICKKFDMASVLSFRKVNHKARSVIDSLLEYPLLATHAVTCMIAMRRSGSASGIPLAELYRLLCDPLCSVCQKDYGNMLSLVTWSRCCPNCLRLADGVVPPQIAVTTVEKAEHTWNLKATSLRRLHTFKILRNHYTTARYHVVPLQRVAAIWRRANVGVELLPSTPRPSGRDVDLVKKTMCLFPWYDKVSMQIERGVSCAGCQVIYEKELEEYGSPYTRLRRREILYSRNAFWEHFKVCEPAQKLWDSSQGGTIKPPGLPRFCEVGGYPYCESGRRHLHTCRFEDGDGRCIA